jgi:hypothetical protein
MEATHDDCGGELLFDTPHIIVERLQYATFAVSGASGQGVVINWYCTGSDGIPSNERTVCPPGTRFVRITHEDGRGFFTESFGP